MTAQGPDTRLRPERYLDLLHREGEALLLAAEEALDRPVPSCPGWTVDDVVFHVGSVYAHKSAALRLGRRPEEGEWSWPPEDASGAEDLAWCHAELHGLSADLGRRASDDPAWTWWDPDQSVGFWLRRMAQETAMHRADVELACGRVPVIPADLAVDGIDEFVAVMLADAAVDDVDGPILAGPSVSVRITDVVVSGDPSRVLLWLWGRGADDSVRLDAAPDAVARVRQVLRDATQ
jgi:uncharacterized protein (TIGR03083 family)